MDQSLLPNIYDFISRTYPFSQLDTLEKDAVAAAVKISYHTPEDRLDNEALSGAGLYMIRSGAAEEILKNDHTLRSRLCAGDTFGYTQIDKTGESDYEVIFLENTLLYFISKSVLQFLILKNRQVGEYFNSKEWIRISSSLSYADDFKSLSHGMQAQDAGSICRRGIPSVSPDLPIRELAQRLAKSHSYLATVVEQGRLVGVVTTDDVALRAVAAGLPGSSPVRGIMSGRVITIAEQASSFEALELMVMHNVHSLPVLKDGQVLGLVTISELMRNSTLEAVSLIRDIKDCGDFALTRALGRRTRRIFEALLGSQLQPHTVERLLSRIADRFYAKVIELALIKLGPAPCPFCVAAAGSLARGEIQLLSDQDNAIITSRELSPGEERWFHEFADLMCRELRECGYPECDGGYMASNPRWCVSLERWQEYYAAWIADTSPAALLNSLVFLDIRCVYGDELLLNRLKQHLLTTVNGNSRFLATLCAASTGTTPPIGTFRQFVLTRDRKNSPYLNIKSQAVNLIVQLARLYGLAAMSGETDTYSRLKAAEEAGLIRSEDCRELTEAYTFLNSVRFRHQLDSLNAGRDLTNNLSPSELSQFERNHLRDAFRIIARHQGGARMRFCPGMAL